MKGWLNVVELWFAELTSKAVRLGRTVEVSVVRAGQ